MTGPLEVSCLLKSRNWKPRHIWRYSHEVKVVKHLNSSQHTTLWTDVWLPKSAFIRDTYSSSTFCIVCQHHHVHISHLFGYSWISGAILRMRLKKKLNSDVCIASFLLICRRINCRVGSRPSDHCFRSVCLSVCLFVCAEFFSAVFDPISIKLGHMLYVWV